ncbi:MAG: hypothetical protein EBT83_10500 [Betaproteobacteria bacterium]|nr:hypothetical protein [Betaproteobacteria bacterium]
MGVPTASIIGSGFLKQAEVILKGIGVPLAIGVYPGAPMVDSEAELIRKVEESLAPGLLKGLTGDAPVDADKGSEPQPGSVVFSGDYDAVQEYFYKNLWTDGLPVTPPTQERVDTFLRFTDRKADEVLRVIPQEGREASILSIAITGVMSGCRPEYMPLLIAIIDAMCDPLYRVEDSGSTPGWEPVVIVNGPIVKELDFNYGQGVMRVGRQANTSIGRFVRMYLRNICGFRIPPGAGDKGSIGQTFLVAMAEDEDSATALGWPTYGEDRGFKKGENVVTVHSVVAITSPMYSGGDDAKTHVQQWTDIIGGSFTYWAHTGFKTGLWSPLIIAGPSIAGVIAKEWTKDQVRQYMYDNMKVTAAKATHYAQMTSTPTFNFESLVEQGILPPSYTESKDPQRLVHTLIKPEMVEILVAGDPGRNQSRAYMSNHVQGPPTSRKVVLPKNWSELLAKRKQ